jgi:hypothetical protein
MDLVVIAVTLLLSLAIALVAGRAFLSFVLFCINHQMSAASAASRGAV